MIKQLRYEARILRKVGANARADLMDNAADLMEQLQARVVELERELTEEKDSHKTTYSLMLSGEKRGTQKATEELQPKIDALAAHVERIVDVVNNERDVLIKLAELFKQSPTNSLAERDAKIILESAEKIAISLDEDNYIGWGVQCRLMDAANECAERVKAGKS